jgi:hypothetical protein
MWGIEYEQGDHITVMVRDTGVLFRPAPDTAVESEKFTRTKILFVFNIKLRNIIPQINNIQKKHSTDCDKANVYIHHAHNYHQRRIDWQDIR